MTLFDINTDRFDPKPEFVGVEETHIGKAVFSLRGYPAAAVIGEIQGRLSGDKSENDEYTFEFGEDLNLHPAAPFRFLNHSCNPNCEFDLIDQPATEHQPLTRSLYLIAIRMIQPGEALTIDYNWPASCAIRCECGERKCRGWVVAKSELADVSI